jgi:hypothetical protein
MSGGGERTGSDSTAATGASDPAPASAEREASAGGPEEPVRRSAPGAPIHGDDGEPAVSSRQPSDYVGEIKSLAERESSEGGRREAEDEDPNQDSGSDAAPGTGQAGSAGRDR